MFEIIGLIFNNIYLPFIEWLQSFENCDLSIVKFKEYCIYIQGKKKRNGVKLSSSSVNSALRAVKAFYNYCISENYTEDVSKKLKLPRMHKIEQKILTMEEIKVLFTAIKADKLSLRNKCIALLMLDSGFRKGEIVRLRICDIDWKTSSVMVNGKGFKQRIVPIGEKTKKRMREYYNACRGYADEESSFFVNNHYEPITDNAIKQCFYALKKVTGIERLHPHLLRHTFATMYIVNGGNLETLRCILGHTSIQTTQIYLHFASNYKLITENFNSYVDGIDFIK